MEKDFHYEGSQSEAGRVQTPNSTSKRVSEGGLDKEIDQLREIRREAHAGAAQRVKELNPDLFGEKRSGRMSHYDIPEQFKDSQHIQQDRQITELRSQLHSIQEAARSTNSQFQDLELELQDTTYDNDRVDVPLSSNGEILPFNLVFEDTSIRIFSTVISIMSIVAISLSFIFNYYENSI
jgi:hypothetical protein